MSRITLLPALAAAAVLLAFAGPALPQSQPSAGRAVAFSANDGGVSPTSFELIGQAEIVQDTNRLRANRIVGTRGQGGSITRAEASGDVYFVTTDQSLRGDRAVFTPGNDEIVLTGDVVLTQGRNVLTGERVVYNTRTETARIDGGGGNGRIQGVFYPESGN